MKILSVFGTRPEAIKMAPVIQAMAKHPQIESRICISGQHKALMDQVLSVFDIRPDYDLTLMTANQDLSDITAATLLGVRSVLAEEKPDWVLVHGDTVTAMAASIAAVFASCKIAHVEAGLRTGDRTSPWPEEANRRIIDHVADLYFAPTEHARNNLLSENLSASRICVTGNTVVDALHIARNRLRKDQRLVEEMERKFSFIDFQRPMILVTTHRRESFGAGLNAICSALAKIASRGDCTIVHPVHPNPQVLTPVNQRLHACANVHILPPQDYLSFVYLMEQCSFIMTDSGGIQEEAPSLGKPILLMRDVTERPEAVASGAVTLVGTVEHQLVEAARNALQWVRGRKKSDAGQWAPNPYGDGDAARRIVEALRCRQQPDWDLNMVGPDHPHFIPPQAKSFGERVRTLQLYP